MNDQQASNSRSQLRAALAGRLRSVREQLYGEDGHATLADQVGVPAQTWANYEAGVMIPGDILLRFIVITETNPAWLLHGVGSQHSAW